MRKITDPNLLAQLEAAPSNYKKVTDPNIIAQLEGNEPQQQNWQKRLENSFPGGLATSVGNQVMDFASMPEQLLRGGAHTINSLLNKIPGVNIPLPDLNYRTLPRAEEPENPGLGYQAGHFVGEAAPWMVPGAMAGKAALKLGGKVFGAVNPGKTALTLQELLTKESGNAVRAPSGNLYNKVFEGTKHTNIYGENIGNKNIAIQDLIENVEKNELPDLVHRYIDLNPQEIKTAYVDSGLKRLHNVFEKHPTLENAHKLQSQLGTEVRGINKKGKLADAADKAHKESYEYARDILKNDINSFLEGSESGLGKSYKEATRLHRENVIPHENAIDIIGQHVNAYTNKINPGSLSKALENAYNIKSLKNNPIPQEVMKLNELLKNQLRNKNYAIKAASITGGALGLNKIRHLLGY
jgi:hypothetical protein